MNEGSWVLITSHSNSELLMRAHILIIMKSVFWVVDLPWKLTMCRYRFLFATLIRLPARISQIFQLTESS